MSFKKFSSAQDAPSKDNFTDNSKDSPTTGQPVAQSEKPSSEAVLVEETAAENPTTGEAVEAKSDESAAAATSEP